MSDRYTSFARSGAGRAIVKRLGLPNPPKLPRFKAGDALIPGPVLVGPSDGPRAEGLGKLLGAAEAEKYHGLVFDATGITSPAGLQALYDFFHPVARSLTPAGRVIVLGLPPQLLTDPARAAAQQALDGFVRSVGKEFGRGTTAQLVRVHPAADTAALRATLEFLLSAKSAYVSGQTVTVDATPAPVGGDLTGKIALVTGAARGIGAAMARVLARDGAHVVCLDVPAAGEDLAKVANEVRGEAYQLDLTGADAARKLADHLRERHGRIDVVVHNAGITRDKTLANMDRTRWDSVLRVNLIAPTHVTDVLLAEGLIPAGGRIVGVASIAGVAGNRGQTNYAASKAGVIGWVRALAPALAEQGITVNAVAPGFIETAMTAKMPMVIREAGRRMNSLSQGGLPVDVAETVAWFAAPGSANVTGNVVRVCGQSLLGA
ncbi:3-oxoacyl-ACP reductase [Catellatospora sp. KI3]|uniref:3-oxoacyl-ACP reductase n=1 Tax=Catellatospora sp. KI3 TaxID=3041620 RepID=UPI0024823739|nr:3-oxoacyl-ACP reductase [Catellatospora sp. KI3]MDI1461801.1 3-oxoacyl-ACP reductase [Catellatospora sp. KI3]